MTILDVGCGPGTITVDLARLVPDGEVIGLENAPEVLEVAKATIEARGVKNVRLAIGDVHVLEFADATFDVVHAHQVLQHIGDPVQALREMKRVTKPGGIVACREWDCASMIWYPESEELEEFHKLYTRVARANGGEPNAGRRLHSWARQAGFDPARITATATSWCFSSPEERAWWSGLWADRVVASTFASSAKKNGLTSDEELHRISKAWRDWGAVEDGWNAFINGEILCRV